VEDVVLKWGPVLIMLVSLVFTISSSRGKATSERAREIEQKLERKAESTVVTAVVGKVDILEDHVATLMGEIRHLPSRDQTHELALALRDMRGELSVLTERLKPISHTSERLQEWLIDEAKGKRGAA